MFIFSLDCDRYLDKILQYLNLAKPLNRKIPISSWKFTAICLKLVIYECKSIIVKKMCIKIMWDDPTYV